MGDVWEYDFTKMSFQDIKLEGPESKNINRSNQTAVYYSKTDS